ncbi:hypothetical protein DSCA_22550 [Desulfosarcina alkanivorans]|uniref:DUF11 domain-containing protein n=1 Tax=Desulfosarcina alkanivorans TaxID=571177 RepID=A0A5K7YIW0_9BACT|nr:choice-of-anchor X domain-containing protein [Desulfosarcina alkanivorans]BBO68325.1 hypothetical protein DSCA_22550 [Desulfosarcina alkanivorans]
MHPPIRTYPTHPHWIIGLLVALMTMVAPPCRADLRSGPTWFDANGVGSAPDWHYRAPITIPSDSVANSTIRIDVDFDALLTALGISGTFDADSPRIVKEDGSLAAIQQFTDTVYAGGTDEPGNGQGEIRFILEESGPSTCYLYFDITENGTKAPWPAADTINGNFELDTDNLGALAGWDVDAESGFDAEVRPGETVTVNAVSTDGTPHTGEYAFLLGSRSADEPVSASPAVTLSRSITVPASNPGSLTLRYRAEGWDSSADYDSRYDFIRIRIDGDTVVGPDAGNYAGQPYSPNYGTGYISWNEPGYGRYNYWDRDTGGDAHLGMGLSAGDEPWFDVSASLTAYAGQTVTLEITSNHVHQYRSWFHVDDVAWSVRTLSLGEPQAFGADISRPLTAFPGRFLSIAAVVDARADSVLADVYDQDDNLAAAGIVLFDDGSHGDAAANDGIWSNNGADPAYPTVAIPSGAAIGGVWTTVVLALDGSGNRVSATDGLVHNPSVTGTDETQANFFNIDEQGFTIIEPVPDLSTSTKTVVDLNGGSLYPGDVLAYTITLVESAGMPAADVRVTDVLPASVTGFNLISIPSEAAGTFTDATGTLDVSGISLPGGGSDTIVFEVTVGASAATGATIDNTAAITVPGGTGAGPTVSSPPVSAIPATGNKQLYLRTTTALSRTPPEEPGSNQRIVPNSSHSWTLTPALQQALTIQAGTVSVPVRLMMSRPNLGSSNRSTSIDIDVSGIGSLTNIPVTVGGSVLEYNFSIPLASAPPFSLPPGTAPVLTVSTSNRAIRVYTTSGGTPSRVLLGVDTVINVDSVGFYDDAYPGGTAVASAPPGNTVYVRSVISDPFGSFDISGAFLTLEAPSGGTVLNGVAMDEVLDSGAATKVFETAYDLPGFGSDGTWTATVTATEGTEGTIIHQGAAPLFVGAPLLTVLKSASSTAAGPGDLITYTVQVVNTGTSAAVNIEMDDAMSPYTALRIAYDGTGALPFSLEAAPVGLALGAPVYSDDGGSTYGYSPLVSGGGGAQTGFDGRVSHWRLPVVGTLEGSGSKFTMKYQVVVK